MIYSVLITILLVSHGSANSPDDDGFRVSVLKRLEMMESNEYLLKAKLRDLEAEIAAKNSKIDQLDETVRGLVDKVHTLEGELDARGVARPARQFVNGSPVPHVAFTAYLDHTIRYDLNPQLGSKIVFNKVLLNDGGRYNNATGVFMAPASGVYLFSYSVGAKNYTQSSNLTQFDIFTELVVDGVRQLSSVAESTNHFDDEQGSTTMVIYVDEGSEVWVKHLKLGGHAVYSLESARVTSFTGMLLYTSTSK